MTVCGYGTLLEAQIVCAQLTAAGVFAVVPDQLSGGIVGDFIGGTAGIRVQVPQSQLARARAVLALPAEPGDLGQPPPDSRGSANPPPGRLARSPRGAPPEISRLRAQGPETLERPASSERRVPSQCPTCGTELFPSGSRAWWRRLQLALFGLSVRCTGCRRELRDLV